MRIPDAKLAEIWDRGFTVVESFLDSETLAAAQEALWGYYPRPEEYFADPEAHAKFAASQFAGLRLYPYNSWALNRIPVYPDLIDAAERFLRPRKSTSTRSSSGPSTLARSTTTSLTTATTATTASSCRAPTA